MSKEKSREIQEKDRFRKRKEKATVKVNIRIVEQKREKGKKRKDGKEHPVFNEHAYRIHILPKLRERSKMKGKMCH